MTKINTFWKQQAKMTNYILDKIRTENAYASIRSIKANIRTKQPD